MTFEALLKKMPTLLFGNFDALTHKTAGDLAAIAEHELDLFHEGEESDIRTPKQAGLVRKFKQLASAVAAEEVAQ